MGEHREEWINHLNVWADQEFTHIYYTLDWAGLGQAPESKWMDMPTTALLICQCFGVVLQLFSLNESTTFFPLFTDPKVLPEHRIISMAWVKTDHFIMLNIAEDAPMPRPHAFWRTHVDKWTNPWLRLYMDRLERGKRLHPSNTTGKKSGLTLKKKKSRSV